MLKQYDEFHNTPTAEQLNEITGPNPAVKERILRRVRLAKAASALAEHGVIFAGYFTSLGAFAIQIVQGTVESFRGVQKFPQMGQMKVAWGECLGSDKPECVSLKAKSEAGFEVTVERHPTATAGAEEVHVTVRQVIDSGPVPSAFKAAAFSDADEAEPIGKAVLMKESEDEPGSYSATLTDIPQGAIIALVKR